MAKAQEMQTYTAAVVVTLHSGKVKLTADQARRRMHCLKGSKAGQKSGIFTILSPIQFKVGEEFGYDGDMPKAMIGQLEIVGDSEDASGAGGSDVNPNDGADGDGKSEDKPETE